MRSDISFIIADNQDITRAGLHAYLSALYDGCHTTDVIGKRELIQALTRCGESVVILDYTLFDVNGRTSF